MEKILFMGHSVFLSPKNLQKVISGKEVSVDGVAVPVIQNANGVNTEPAGEMITKYHIKVGDSNKILGLNRGFTVSLVRPEDLLPPPTGCRWINFNSTVQSEGGKSIHQVVVQPEEILIESWMDRDF